MLEEDGPQRGYCHAFPRPRTVRPRKRTVRTADAGELEMHFLTHLRGRHAHNVPPLPELLAFAHDAQVLARLRRIAYDGKRERQRAAARPIAVSAPAKGLQRPPSHGAPPKRRGLRLHVGAVRSVRRTRHEEQDGEDKSSLRRALSAWSSHRKGAATRNGSRREGSQEGKECTARACSRNFKAQEEPLLA